MAIDWLRVDFSWRSYNLLNFASYNLPIPTPTISIDVATKSMDESGAMEIDFDDPGPENNPEVRIDLTFLSINETSASENSR